MFKFFKKRPVDEMGMYHIAAECELMNVEDLRSAFLELFDEGLAALEVDPPFGRPDTEAMLTGMMERYDEKNPEVRAGMHRNLEAYYADAATKGLRQQFEQYVAMRLDMIRFDMAFRGMNKEAVFCDKHGIERIGEEES